jgi:salicylate hydroxylase
LQQALITKVPPGIICLNKRLIALHDLNNEGVLLLFEDGEEVIADLVRGADGLRWRIAIVGSLVHDIPEMTTSIALRHGPAAHFYNCVVDNPTEESED